MRRRLGQATAITMYILIGISVAWSLLYVCFMCQPITSSGCGECLV